MNILNFDANLFDSLLDAASNTTGPGGTTGTSVRKPKNTFLKHPGIKLSISNTPAGGFAYKRANKKNVLIDKIAKQVRGVVLNSEFAMAQWGKEDNKPKMLCSSISNTLPSGETSNGIWNIPFFGNRLTTIYDPQGSKGMSCRDCIEQKLNEGCKQGGGVHLLITGMDHGEMDDDDNFIGMQDVEPFIAYIQVSGIGSGLEYSKYLTSLKSLGNKPAANTMEAVFSTQDNPKAPVKMLKIDIGLPFSDQDTADKLYGAELKKLAEDEAKKLEEWKAKNPNKISKRAVSGDEDLPF